MQIELSHDHQEFLEHLVSEGRYRSINQAMIDAINLLERREALRLEVQKGVDDADAGRLRPVDEVISEIRARHELGE